MSLTSTKRVVLDSGLILLLLENHDLPIVSVQTFSRASQLYESEDQAGLANLVGMLLEDGTKDRTADQIAAAMEFVGGRLGTGPTGVEATVLAKDTGLALDVVFDILMNASFPEDRSGRRGGARADRAARATCRAISPERVAERRKHPPAGPRLRGHGQVSHA